MQQNTGTLTVRLPGVAAPIAFADWAYDHLWHTVQAGFSNNNAAALTAFIGTRGQSIPGGTRQLTPADTNIPRSGENGLSLGWEMLIYSIKAEVARETATATGSSATLGDAAGTNESRPAHVGGSDPAYLSDGVLFQFLRQTYFSFVVNNKIKNEGRLSDYPQGGGISVFGTTSDLEVANNGVPSPRDQQVLVLPIHLQPDISYQANIQPSAAIQNATPPAWSDLAGAVYSFDVVVTLDGLLKRPVT
jgi:hypothetical protein